ncbi:MAG TPA: TlpA disulfide reductase family protein [Hyphomonas sp.]|nr:TlpA disulfide reductase family protein [Hyphomonas sp.]HRX74191.1 TlpA disulfide reductase family protein [Hyphomonas sp.]
MKVGLWLSAAAALVAGFAAGLLARPWLMPSQPDPTLLDLSALPEELRDQHRDPDFLKKEIEMFDAIKEAQARFEAKMAARTPLELPDGMSAVPLGKLFQPDSGAHWPDGVDGDIGDALEAGKDGWVILNFWASWCAPCVHELPEMGEAAPIYAERGVTLIAVNTDVMRRDTPESARDLFAKKGVRNLEPYVAQGPAVDTLLGASGQTAMETNLPTTLIFAPGGVPYAMFQGGEMDKPKVWTAPETLAFLDAITSSQ